MLSKISTFLLSEPELSVYFVLREPRLQRWLLCGSLTLCPSSSQRTTAKAGSSRYGIRPFVYLDLQKPQSSGSRIILILQEEYIPLKGRIPCNYSVKWQATHIHRAPLAEETKCIPKAFDFYWSFSRIFEPTRVCLCLFRVPKTFHKLFHLVSGRLDFSTEVVQHWTESLAIYPYPEYGNCRESSKI